MALALGNKLMVIQEPTVLSWAQRSVLVTRCHSCETQVLTIRLQFIPAKESLASERNRKAILETRDGGSSTVK